MTKMQIIAKTILTVLGIHIVLVLCHLYLTRYVGPVDKLPALLAEDLPTLLAHTAFCAGFTALVVSAAYFMIANNHDLALRMAGPGRAMDRQAQMTWLTKSLRTGLVFAGLMMLPGFMPKGYSLNDSLIDTIFMCTKAVLTLYLICGAPHFVRWQTGRSLRQTVTAGQAETSNFSAESSERTPNG
jgi:hypothetical protein